MILLVIPSTVFVTLSLANLGLHMNLRKRKIIAFTCSFILFILQSNSVCPVTAYQNRHNIHHLIRNGSGLFSTFKLSRTNGRACLFASI